MYDIGRGRNRYAVHQYGGAPQRCGVTALFRGRAALAQRRKDMTPCYMAERHLPGITGEQLTAAARCAKSKTAEMTQQRVQEGGCCGNV